MDALAYFRMTVDSWDDRCLRGCRMTDGAAVSVCYVRDEAHDVYDWSPLRRQLKPGAQLNVVGSVEDNGIYYPDLLILEPDYLVDISSIASCFESYATSPLIHLLNQLRPPAQSQAILLGNLASQMLDEELTLPLEENTYERSVRRFFRDNAVALLTVGPDRQFHTDARQQKENIRQAIREGLTRRSDSFQPGNVMVEPSFFSEMLGLQGRMDFLQLDFRLLIEQKSGKGGFPQHSPDIPVAQTKHYVQLLLYMLLIRYNYQGVYEQNGGKLDAFLFYSKYSCGLLAEKFSPCLVRQAIAVRNGIVSMASQLAAGGIGLLSTLTAGQLNEKHVTSRLWERYQKPQIERLLAPYGQASPLERSYFERLYTFVAAEHLQAKTGRGPEAGASFADMWRCSLEDKLQAGCIFDGLSLLSPAADDAGRVERVVLGFDGSRPLAEVSNFRVGDIVMLYPYDEGGEPDARRTMVFRCSIEALTDETVTLSMRNDQTHAHVLWHGGQRRWAVEHDFYESSFTALYRALYSFLSAPKERRDLILMQRTPRCDASQRPKGNYGSFQELALRVAQAQDLFLIIGPPGTGKTSFGLVNTLREELLNADASVLLLAYTNRAVDEICGKLEDESLDYIRIGGRFACEQAYRPYLIDAQLEGCQNMEELRQLIASTRIFVGTTTAFNSSPAFFRLKQFSLAIVDEASQILEPHLLGLMSAVNESGQSAVRKFVLIGDHKQLPAVVQQPQEQSVVQSQALQAIGLTDCRRSLFERLLDRYRDDPRVVFMLTRQGRMHHDIALFPNRVFYQGRLEEVPLPHQCQPLPSWLDCRDGIERLLQTRRLLFVNVEPEKNAVGGKTNMAEAEAIAATVRRIRLLAGEAFAARQTVGIIVPYRQQIASIRQTLARCPDSGLDGITIDTVERFQGSQRDYIVYGFTVHEPSQLTFLTENVFQEDGCTVDRKLNVAMTRARRHLIIIGNARLLETDAVFARLIDFFRSQDAFVNVPLEDYVDGRF